MGKIADRYFEVDPWSVMERGFDSSHGLVSESIFSLGNEYMGVRGYFEEGYGGEKHVGSYFNGFYEETPIYHPARYKGFVDISRDMTNTVDWLYIRILIDGEQLDLGTSTYEDYSRKLDFKTGILTRSFVWTTKTGKKLRISFERLLSMKVNYLACQHISLEPLNFTGELELISGMDFSIHAPYFKEGNCSYIHSDKIENIYAILGETKRSGLRIYSSYRMECNDKLREETIREEQFFGNRFHLMLQEGKATELNKIVINYAATKQDDKELVWDKGYELSQKYSTANYEQIKQDNLAYWTKIWDESDIVIEGDPENQQGIRFCIFQLHQTYRGSDDKLNIGAKGLSGEAYGGKAFWDTEAYCLQFYIFNNPEAAKKLLTYRYNLLDEARARAKELDCEGACYPISTIDGIETCGAWQHSSLQIHVSGAIAFGIFNYDKICQDKEFLYSKGIEMLLEISRFYASRVQKNPLTGEYGYYGVMGVDEFHMMVNNNCFTNYLAKKALEFTLEVVEEMVNASVANRKQLLERLDFKEQELEHFREISTNMGLPRNEEGLYEQHDGFFSLPHIDLDSIPISEFPLYNHWSYDRIYRTDMIKQADVLMMMFMYSNDFSKEEKRINYDYYEYRCIHESSLSPSVHSIIASEIGKQEDAFDFFHFATRLDLDNYNRNTNEGLHMTSIAAAWMNIVYGFGGLRSDGELLSFSPTIPPTWTSYSFSLIYHKIMIQVRVFEDEVVLSVNRDESVELMLYDKKYVIDQNRIRISIPVEYRSKVIA